MPHFNVCITETVEKYFVGVEAPDEEEARRQVGVDYLNGKRKPDDVQIIDRWTDIYTED